MSATTSRNKSADAARILKSGDVYRQKFDADVSDAFWCRYVFKDREIIWKKMCIS